MPTRSEMMSHAAIQRIPRELEKLTAAVERRSARLEADRQPHRPLRWWDRLAGWQEGLGPRPEPRPEPRPVRHADDCEAILSFRKLLADLDNDPQNVYLQGAFNEYRAGGDQEVELCDCGAIDLRGGGQHG